MNHSLETYKQLYSEYLHQLVELHNHHYIFLFRMGKPSARDVRKSLQTMIRLERKLYATSWAAYHESIEINKILKLQKRETGIQAKLFRQQKKRDKLNKSTTVKRKKDDTSDNHN